MNTLQQLQAWQKELMMLAEWDLQGKSLLTQFDNALSSVAYAGVLAISWVISRVEIFCQIYRCLRDLATKLFWIRPDKQQEQQ